jgi:hypothetical protein
MDNFSSIAGHRGGFGHPRDQLGVAEPPPKATGVASATPMAQLGWPATQFLNFNIFFLKNK